jgi:hypothetical protein
MQHDRLRTAVEELLSPRVQVFGPQRNGLLIAWAEAGALYVDIDLINNFPCPAITQDRVRRSGVQRSSVQGRQ